MKNTDYAWLLLAILISPHLDSNSWGYLTLLGLSLSLCVLAEILEYYQWKLDRLNKKK